MLMEQNEDREVIFVTGIMNGMNQDRVDNGGGGLRAIYCEWNRDRERVWAVKQYEWNGDREGVWAVKQYE